MKSNTKGVEEMADELLTRDTLDDELAAEGISVDAQGHRVNVFIDDGADSGVLVQLSSPAAVRLARKIILAAEAADAKSRGLVGDEHDAIAWHYRSALSCLMKKMGLSRR